MLLLPCTVICGAMVLAQASPPPVVPRTETETLSGKKITLPDAFAGRTAVVIVGFTKASQSQTSAWSTRLAADFGAESRLVRFSMASLEGVPGFVRGFVIAGMKRGVPSAEHDAFLLLLHDEKAWKALVGFERADEGYVLLLDAAGRIVTRAHGPPESEYTALHAAIRRLLE